MSSLQVLGDPDTVLAFALGGIPGHAVHTAADARQAVAEAVEGARATAGTGTATRLLVITGRVAQMARDLLDAAAVDAHGLLVLEIPGFGETPGHDPVGQFVERVLGVRL